MACSAAAWNEDQRYIAMLACGCALVEIDGVKRPSVKNPANSQRSFESLMALAESSANARGRTIPGPSLGTGHRTWWDVCGAESDREIAKIRRIAAEACERLPGRFTDPSGIVHGLALRVIAKDDPSVHLNVFALLPPPSPLEGEGPAPAGGEGHIDLLHQLDPSQVRRVLEALRAWVGRVMHECGVRPLSFEAPRSAVARAARSKSFPSEIRSAPSPRSGEGGASVGGLGGVPSSTTEVPF